MTPPEGRRGRSLDRAGVGGAVLALAIVAGHLTLFPKVADLDAFYHVGHATAYAQGSILDTSLPWATQSVIADYGADIWWGFHVALLPISATGSIEWSIRLGALLLTCALVGSFLWALRRHGVPGVAWWGVVFVMAVPNVFFRNLTVRPHLLSLAAAVLLLSVLARGRWWQALLLSASITWLHLSLFWLGPGVVMAYALVRALETASGASGERSSVPLLRAIAAVVAGTVLGWILRPHPIEAGALASVQIIRLLAEKATEEPLTFSAELYPMGLGELVRSCWLFLSVWLGAAVGTAVYALRGGLDDMKPEQRTMLYATLLVSTAFLALALLSARRAIVEWVAFGSLALAILGPRVRPLFSRPRLRVGLAAVLGLHLAFFAWRHTLNVDLVASAPDTMERVAAYLEENSEPGEVVFHAKWDNFGPLFARNRSNRYLGGMDPIFQFSHDPRLYWEFFYLSTDVTTEWTCDAFPCATGTATDTHQVLVEHFGARWVVVEPRRNPLLSLYLLNDDRYALALETDREALFEVLADFETSGP